MNYYQEFPYGNAGFATPEMIDAAGLTRAPEGLYLGQDELGRVCFSDQQSAVLLQGGARGFKGDHILPWLIDGHFRDHIIAMDLKGQNGQIAQFQVLQGRNVINFNPRGTGNITAHRINPLAYLRSDSPTLIPDAKIFSGGVCPLDGSSNGAFFQEGAQRINEAVTVTLARIDGVATFPRLADLISRIGGLSDEWLSFEEQMAAQPEPSIAQVVEELQEIRNSKEPNLGGWSGIKGELLRGYSCLSDPQLRAATSAPFDWCFSELTKPSTRPTLVNIMESLEFSKTSALVIKAIYTAAWIYKRRNIRARKQVWLLDEIGNIGNWPMAVHLATIAAGYGIRAIYVVQSTAQLDNLAPRASEIIPNSCGTQIYKAVRDLKEAQRLSSMIGKTTIELPEFRMNEAARIAKDNALYEVFGRGIGDPYEAGRILAQQESYANYHRKHGRNVQEPNEILNMLSGYCIVFMPGTIARPMVLKVPHYWQRPELAGRYLPDPFHSPDGLVEINYRGRQGYVPVITAPVPAHLSDWPQYSSGQWQLVQGFQP